MMPLRRRLCFISVRSCVRPKFIANGHSTLNKNITFPVDDASVKKYDKDVTWKIKPAAVKPDSHNVEVGIELVGNLCKTEITSVLQSFFDRGELNVAAWEKGINDSMLQNIKASFKKYCLDVNHLPSDLHIILCDVVKGHGHVLDLLPYFLQHALLVYPHLKYKEELNKIGDLKNPETWYTSARSISRKIFFHYGPTNSGKTYKALERFLEAEKGIYCAPLKLLAHEIYEKANKRGVPCDLVTGEEKKKVSPDGFDANHVSCTVEMTSLTTIYDVAVIDEIQMIKDQSRGYAWTRAFLGIAAKEIHLCGERGALQYIEETARRLGEEVECIKYKRLTKLFIENKAVEDFKNIQDGDCIICFSKKDIFEIIMWLDRLKIEYAVIYGTLPPGTKANQCNKFNDPGNKCNVLVATDAVGLGLNLNIRRIVFYTLEKGGEIIPVSLALQIAGRAGRFNSRYNKGYVTVFKKKDIKVLKELLPCVPEPVSKAGLLPVVEQIETFSYYLPNLSFTELLDTFNALCTLNDYYFMCDLSNMKRLAALIQHMQLSIKSIFTFSCSPVNYNSLLCRTLFVKFAKKYSLNEVITAGFMKKFLCWPFKKKPLNLGDIEALEEAFDCLDLYLWFGNRFPTLFPDSGSVRVLQEELDNIVLEGIADLRKLVRKTEAGNKTPVKTEEHVIERGILSPTLMAKLKAEWLKEMKDKGDKSQE